jgi:hypothetical protein
MPLIFSGAVGLAGAVEVTGNGYVPPPPPPYFIANGPASSVSEGRSVAVDSLGNMYVVSSTTSGVDIGIVKYSVSTGAVVWQYKIDSGSTGDGAKSIYIDGSDNIYISGSVIGGVGFQSPGRLFVAKLNTSGAIQWQRHIATSSGNDASADAYDMAVDSAGNVIVCGDSRIGAFIAKLNSSGVVQWFKTANSIQQIRSVATDSSNNIYLMGQGTLYANGSYGVPLAIVKLNASGVQQWNKTYGGSQLVGGLAVSASGYVYAAFNGAVSSGVGAILAKLSATDGSQVWQRTLNLTSVPAYAYGGYVGVGGLPYTTTNGGNIAIDGSENVYWASIIAYNHDGNVGMNNYRAVIAKYNSSGAIQWQNWMYRTPLLSHPNGFDYFNTITADNSGSVYAVGRIDNKNTLVKLPANGTLAGTYSVGGTSIIYGTSNVPDSAGPTAQANDNNQALSALTGYVETTTSYTPVATAFTVTTVTIG